MTIFKPTFTDRTTGKARKTESWYIRFTDHNKIPRRLPAFTDKGASESLDRKMERLVAARANRDPIPADLQEWVDGLDDATRKKFTEWDLLDARTLLAARPLSEHIDAWLDDLRNKGKTENHIELLRARVNKLFTACGFTRYADLDSEKVNRQLALMRQKNGDKPGASVQTTNHYAGTARQLCRWMVKNGRATEAKLAGVEKGTVAT
ncbi:MAG: hypothetical protein L0Z53_21625, partial [Acidobacteriales bacterium]|nr:hypothetical protein [Terriglobales bacterium]